MMRNAEQKKPADSSCLMSGTTKYHIVHFHIPVLKQWYDNHPSPSFNTQTHISERLKMLSSIWIQCRKQ